MPIYDEETGEKVTPREAAQINLYYAAILAQDMDDEPQRGDSLIVDEMTEAEHQEYHRQFWKQYERLRKLFAATLDKHGRA
jgi:hypothetical protein